MKKIFYRPGFQLWKMLSSRHTTHRTRFELKHKQYSESAIEIYSANIRAALSLPSGQHQHQPSSVNMTLSADNIQMISYCKLTMTQMSCQLSHFNISHWILWHLCQSGVTVTPGPRNTRNNHNTGPGATPTNCDNLINTVSTDWRKCKLEALLLYTNMIKLVNFYSLF